MTTEDLDRDKPISEKLPAGELRPDDRGQDEVREALEDSIGTGSSRPLTRDEREAAEHDKGVANTVYAPASARVPRPPAPGDERLIHREPAPDESPTSETQP
jgi:hypothetical protein